MERTVLTVKALNGYMQKAVRKAAFLQNLCVRGEISNFKAYSSGHWYFTLKDEMAQVSCVMFKSQAQMLDFRPENGLQVEVDAAADFYTRNGQFQLVIWALRRAGLGQLYVAYEKLKKQLEAEGLFSAEHKREIPFLPRKIGVVTSPSGAVIRDIIHVLGRRYPNFQLLLSPCQVQGQGAAGTLRRALALLNRRDDVDVIIIGRGGGSLEDLWAFNDEGLARDIFASRIPVISAVGHETDFTICDFVADLRAPTPSAAAELAVPIKDELHQTVLQLQSHARAALKKQLLLSTAHFERLRFSEALRQPHLLVSRRAQRLDALLSRPVFRDPLSLTREWRQEEDRCRRALLEGLQTKHKELVTRRRELENRLIYGIQREESGKRQRFSGAATRLDALSPLKVLGRGYAMIRKPDQLTPLTSIERAEVGERLRLELADGALGCMIENKWKQKLTLEERADEDG